MGQPVLVPTDSLTLGVVVVDAEFLQPQPGTGARDHLPSAALPIALTVAGWFVFGRVRRPGLRAAPAPV
jgi:hypothetical protein